MNQKFFCLLAVLLLFSVSVVCAENESVVMKPGETYMCGDSFEISFPSQPSTVSMISRNPYRVLNIAYIHAEANKGERLLQIRLRIRNLTPRLLKGLKKDSFILQGYVRDRHLTYLPEIMEPYDFGDYENYRFYSPDHHEWSFMPPLRLFDILLVYRINPILVNWEILINPQPKLGTSYDYGIARYNPIELTPCNATFRFSSIQNAETGEIIKYKTD